MQWLDKRYLSLNYFLREKFGCKVFKISLDAGFSCPNRDGTLNKNGCTFCSERGSGDFAGSRDYSISKQFEEIKNIMKNKWQNGKYIAYFQAYTNTYAKVEVLREKYSEAIEEQGVVALAIATRPDCLSNEILDLLEEFSHKVYLWVELGLQTSNEETALKINRGYKIDVFEESLENLRARNIPVVIHTIFGLPGESEGDMLNTIKYLSKKDIQGIKIHLLHLIKDTAMVKDYQQGKLVFLEKNQYIKLVAEAITLLPPNVVIHRLTGDAPRNKLIGPMWSLKKWEILNGIDDYLKNNNLYQGLCYSPKTQ